MYKNVSKLGKPTKTNSCVISGNSREMLLPRQLFLLSKKCYCDILHQVTNALVHLCNGRQLYWLSITKEDDSCPVAKTRKTLYALRPSCEPLQCSNCHVSLTGNNIPSQLTSRLRRKFFGPKGKSSESSVFFLSIFFLEILIIFFL